MRYSIYKLSYFLVFLSFLSCSDNIAPVSKPKIFSISSNNVIVGDTIALSGENFTYHYAGAKLVFSSGITLQYWECIKWNDNYVKLIIPQNASSGTIIVVNGKDSSNSFQITITTVPLVEMVEIKADSLDMGNVNGLKAEQPVHRVGLTNSFWIGKYEINQRCWSAVMGSNPSIFKGKTFPVHNINWLDAVKFCNKLSETNNIKPYYLINNDTIRIDTGSTGYRLPTEAEWEYCCKAKKNTDFAGTGILDEMGWYSYNSAYVAHETGNKKANDFGLFDMAGNVWEWCWDFYDENYYKVSPKANPAGPKSGKTHVLRGGSFIDGSSYCRSTNRTYPYTTYENCGLRVARNKN
jgi:sulfatase modifying factor 1